MSSLTLVAFTLALTHGGPADWRPNQRPIWPGTPPDSIATAQPETTKVDEAQNVTRPTMTVFAPKGKNTGLAVVVFPGGGYQMLALGIEGTEICDWLTSRGITAILLKYRVPNSGPHWDEKVKGQVTPPKPTARQDAQRTIGLVRQHANEWHIDKHKIGVIGFSAGGHLVADVSTNFRKRAYKPVDQADQQSCRPDFAIALYPGHLWINKNGFTLNPNVPVTKQTPPTFLLQAEDDPVDSINNTLVYYIALKKAGVPVEMHLYAHGGHAFGLRPTSEPITRWPGLVETWLRTIKMLGASRA